MSNAPAAISLVTLGVENVALASEFYLRLGWRIAPQSVEKTAFLQGEHVVLALWQRDEMIRDGGEGDLPRGSGSVALALNLGSESAVDAHYALAVDAGADPVKPPARVFWGGYSGNFRDPDGHLWEIAFNPYITTGPDGRMNLFGEAIG